MGIAVLISEVEETVDNTEDENPLEISDDELTTGVVSVVGVELNWVPLLLLDPEIELEIVEIAELSLIVAVVAVEIAPLL